MANSSCPKLLSRVRVTTSRVAAGRQVPHTGSMERPDPPQSDGLTRRGLITSAAGAVLVKSVSEARAAGAPVGVGYLRWTERRPTISLLDKPAADDGLAG